MDLLTDIVRLMRPQSVLWRTLEERGRWGMSVPQRDEPVFCLVVAGQCCLVPPNGPSVLMKQGDYVMLNASSRYSLGSGMDVMPVVAALAADAGHTDYVRWNDGQDGEEVRLVGGYFQVEPEHTELLASLLPDLLYLRSSDEEAGRLTRIVELIGEESLCELAGRELVMGRLVEIMLVEVLRRPMLRIEGQRTGWLSGMADPQIAMSLQKMHADVAHHWTVDILAKQVGMSRAVFARRFSECVGQAPATYLSNWRIAVAKDALLNSDRSVNEIGLAIGYLSDSAFSTAFSRIVGCSPVSFRREGRRSL
ncbi:AraC family transcriptional regulator [Paraburkholderia sp.]|uniref:AraC family transcriptional regulator n=1 Tax=Paraburkholderia sp. TaxID=1926495 RepID=UPI0023953780|nr:AraC family transcriptional regulator [Paraburkholderia sp.]MDE1180037.1 AraC family transcriptional regulator [Paraburkholderia sp.]